MFRRDSTVRVKAGTRNQHCRQLGSDKHWLQDGAAKPDGTACDGLSPEPFQLYGIPVLAASMDTPIRSNQGQIAARQKRFEFCQQRRCLGSLQQATQRYSRCHSGPPLHRVQKEEMAASGSVKTSRKVLNPVISRVLATEGCGLQSLQCDS